MHYYRPIYLIKRIQHILETKIRYGYNPFAIMYVSPDIIQYVTPPSDIVDVTQFTGNRKHPHAHIDRGYFRERDRIGTVVDGDWDKDYHNIRFDQLLEHRAIKETIEGCDWNKTLFAERAVNFIKSGGTTRNYSSVEDYLKGRKKEVQELIDSISINGVRRVSKSFLSDNIFDEISINIARDGALLFNNRGHHRLSISKILGVKSVPVIVIVRHKHWIEAQSISKDKR